MRVRTGAAGCCGPPPRGAACCPRNQGSPAGALPCPAPGCACGSSRRSSSSILAFWASMVRSASAVRASSFARRPSFSVRSRLRLLLHPPLRVLDLVEAGLRAPRPDHLGGVRVHDPGVDAALRRLGLAAAHAEPGGDRDQHDRGDDREQQQLAPPHRIGVVGVGGRALLRRGRSLRASRAGGLDHRHGEPPARGAGGRRRQPERGNGTDARQAPDGPGEARGRAVAGSGGEAVRFQHERRQARAPPGLDEPDAGREGSAPPAWIA